MPTRPPGTPDIDLTFDDTFGILNGAVFATGLNQPAGTGAFDSFVQLQNGGTEQGYNTDASSQYDEKNSQNHNHSILLADVPIVFGDGTNGTVEGVAYREFLLDLGRTAAIGIFRSTRCRSGRKKPATSPTSRPARDLPAPTPIISPTISMPAATTGSRSTTGSRTAAARATSAS